MRTTGQCTDCRRSTAIDVQGLVCDRGGSMPRPTGVCTDCRTRRSARTL